MEIIDGIKKWDLNGLLDKESMKVSSSNGYWGAYTIVSKDGKENIVYCDDRNAECIFALTEWVDEVCYCKWHGDHRWNWDKPAIIRNNGKYNMVAAPKGAMFLGGKKPAKLIPFDVEDIIAENGAYWRTSYGTDYILAVCGGVRTQISKEGNIIGGNVKAIYEHCKTLSRDETLEQWVKEGKRCLYCHGWMYRGAQPIRITTAQAVKLYPKYVFGTGFYQLSWMIYGGVVCLLFNELGENDML